mmetsp:Transcript_23011/g.48947  ORF Transcript_23011/g.48947 Transcript_23011/m.48947 type:complete len:274 (+) Transcript_23011:340-1161(+)
MRLDGLEALCGPPSSTVTDHLGRKLSAQHGALHAAKEFLARPVTRQREVADGRLLRGAIAIPARDGRVDTPRHTHHGGLPQLRATIGELGANLCGEEPLKLLHGGLHYVLVAARQPIHLAARQRRAGREDEFDHGPVVIVVFLATSAHVCIDRQQGAPAEAEMVDILQLPVEPEVDVDDRNALELLDLMEEWHLRPLLGHNAPEDVARHRRDVLIGHDLLAAAQLEMLHRAVLIQDESLEGRIESHLAASLLDVLLHGCTEPVRLVAIKEGHL